MSAVISQMCRTSALFSEASRIKNEVDSINMPIYLVSGAYGQKFKVLTAFAVHELSLYHVYEIFNP